jgi:ABC-type multidrug transport system ATPase subunit
MKVHVLALFSALLLLVASADHPLPCILSHGCVCNGTMAFQNPVDRQFYGTCVSCDSGWTGRTCSIKSCQNLGALNKSTRACECALPWTGANCTDRLCPHSEGGVGPHHVLPPSNVTAFCDRCEDGFSGLTCDMCSSTRACRAVHSAEFVCSTLFTPRGPKKLLECAVTDARFMGPLGPKRPGVGGRVSLACESEAPGVPFGQSATGTCAVAFFRTEPGDAFIDPFFFCTAANCTAVSAIAATDVSTVTRNPSGSFFSAARQLGEAAIFMISAILCILQWPILDNLRRAIVPKIAAALVVSLVLFVAFSAIAMDTRPSQMRETVSYTCETASCTCAADPPNSSYVPFCQGSVFESVIIPMIQHAITVQCFTDTKECLFIPSDLQTTVKLSCNASECVNATQFPPVSVHDSLVIPAGGNSGSGIAISVSLAALLLGALFVYRHVAQKRTRIAVAEFRSLFLSCGRSDGIDEEDEAVILRGREAGAPDERDDSELAISDRQPLFCSARQGAGGGSLSLEDGSRVRQAMRTEIDLSLSGLCYSLLPPPAFSLHGIASQPPQPILTNVSFTVRSGEMLALMGPSGAGKTTLLDILSARSKPGIVSGSMSLCGDEISEAKGNIAGYRNIVGYVSQEDTLLPALTVRETVEFAAMLKLPCAFSRETIAAVVDHLLESLGLLRCQHTLVGDSTRIRGVSGGERRRVSIAAELVANPRILFLDEPTSGLDACSAYHVMQTVASLAKTSPLCPFAPHFFSFRPIIVFSIHQPSAEIFRLFHKVLLLSRGVVVYHGPAAGAAEAMATRLEGLQHAGPRPELSVNPAEALMQLEECIASDSVRAAMAAGWQGQAVQQIPESVVSAENESPDDADFSGLTSASSVLAAAAAMKRFYPDGWRQWQLLTQRSFTSLVGSYYLVVCHAFVTLLVGSLMNLLYHQEGLDLPGALNRAGSITFLLLVTAFVTLSALDQLLAERKLCIVERENGFYTTLPYLLAKVVVDILPLRIVPVVMLAGVIYSPMGLRTDDGSHWLWFLLILVLFSVCITLAVMCIGIVTSNFGSSALLSSVLILWTFVFGGLLAQSDTMPAALRPIRLLSPFFLAYESLIVNELDGLMCTFAPTDATGKPSTNQIPLMCVQYVFNMGLHPDNFERDVTILVLLCVGLTCLCWVLLANVSSVQR